jgi:hypothetical protein
MADKFLHFILRCLSDYRRIHSACCRLSKFDALLLSFDAWLFDQPSNDTASSSDLDDSCRHRVGDVFYVPSWRSRLAGSGVRLWRARIRSRLRITWRSGMLVLDGGSNTHHLKPPPTDYITAKFWAVLWLKLSEKESSAIQPLQSSEMRSGILLLLLVFSPLSLPLCPSSTRELGSSDQLRRC